VVFSPDGTRVASGAHQGMGLPDDKVRIFEQSSGRLIRALEGHTSGISAVAYSSDGRHVLSGSWDRTAKLWDAETGKVVRNFEHGPFVLSVAISRDGTRVASGMHSVGSEALVQVWDTARGSLLHTLKGHTGNVEALAFSPDGTRLLSATLTGQLRSGTQSAGASYTLSSHKTLFRLWHSQQTEGKFSRVAGIVH